MCFTQFHTRPIFFQSIEQSVLNCLKRSLEKLEFSYISELTDNFNYVSCNDLKFKPHEVQRKLKMTAPVRISVERGPFRKFPVKSVFKQCFIRFYTIQSCRNSITVKHHLKVDALSLINVFVPAQFFIKHKSSMKVCSHGPYCTYEKSDHNVAYPVI